jgi:Flp pilus assembly protein TadD
MNQPHPPTETVEFNLLDLAADDKGQGPKNGLGRRLPALVAQLLEAAGVSARHASATVALEYKRTGWAVAAGLLEEGKAIELSRRMGRTNHVVYGQLGPPQKQGMTLKLRALRRDDAAMVVRWEKDFFAEEVIDVALAVAGVLVELLEGQHSLETIRPELVFGTKDPRALLALQEGLDGMLALQAGVEGSKASYVAQRFLAALKQDPACTIAAEQAVALISSYSAEQLSPDETKDFAEQLVALRPDHREAVLLLARIHRRRDAADEAEQLLRQALEQGMEPRLQLELAQLCLTHERPDEALDLCRQLPRAKEPTEEAERLEIQGLAWARLGQLTEASQVLRQAVQLAPRAARPWANLGRCLHLLGDPAGAQEAYERGHELEPNNWEVARNFFELLAATGQLTRAEELAQVWHEQQPDDPLALVAVAEVMTSRPGNEAKALALLEGSLPKFGDNPQVLALLGSLATQMARLDEAEIHYRRALELCPQEPALLSNLAVVLAQQGNLSAAEKLAEQAVRLTPNDKVSARILAHIRQQN